MQIESIDYLDLEFNSLPSNNSIIFGYNGIGKTSIYNTLKETQTSNVDFLDFDITKTEFKKRDLLSKVKGF